MNIINKIKANPSEVIFTLKDSQRNTCYLQFKKQDGQFVLSGFNHSLGNFQMEFPKWELEWTADENDWKRVINMIETGVVTILDVRSR
jgi:hypothetical protein